MMIHHPSSSLTPRRVDDARCHEARSMMNDVAGIGGSMIHDAAGIGRIADHDAAGIGRIADHDAAGIGRGSMRPA
jgi:hypothetical protein